MAVFETSLICPCTPERAFDFLIRPANHEKLSPPEVGLRFTNPPEVFTLNLEFEFRIQAWGMVQSSRHRITEFQPSTRFVEELVQGPLRAWRHEHDFETTPDGKVIIRDRIEFTPPGGVLGFMATEARIIENLEDGFFHRHQQLQKMLKGQP